MSEPSDAELRNSYVPAFWPRRRSCAQLRVAPQRTAAQETRRRARQTAIEAALRRLDEGDFAACGTFIGTERLDVDPALMRCVDCAQ